MIKKWILKAIVQKTISFMPWAQKLNYLMQNYVTHTVDLTDAYMGAKLFHAGQYLSAWQKFAAAPLKDKSTLELGTGWYPIVPISMYLNGVGPVHTVDISPLMTRERLMATARKFLEYADKGLLAKYFTPVPERLTALEQLTADMERKTFANILTDLHIQYLVQDARRLNLPNHSIDLIHSNNTFEHIYPSQLADILREFVRLLRPGGLMCHRIDMTDHFAHRDNTITFYNFLRFSDRQWRWIDNSIQPQNRMRLSDYLRLYQKLGIPINETEVLPGSLQELRKVPLAQKYRDYVEDDLTVSNCQLVSAVSPRTSAGGVVIPG